MQSEEVLGINNSCQNLDNLEKRTLIEYIREEIGRTFDAIVWRLFRSNSYSGVQIVRSYDGRSNNYIAYLTTSDTSNRMRFGFVE
ncbi:hypothetical protein Trydic_g12959 [Trypoxylus dichotomus]